MQIPGNAEAHRGSPPSRSVSRATAALAAGWLSLAAVASCTPTPTSAAVDDPGSTVPRVGSAAASGLLVVSAGQLSSRGPEGGPFTPDQIGYTVSNAGTRPISWFAVSSVNWLLVSNPRGFLQPGEQATLMVVVDPVVGPELAAGSYLGFVAFLNVTDIRGTTARLADLTVESGQLALGVAPSTGFVARGPEGGPFSPASRDFVLSNPGTQPLDWAAAPSAAWMGISATGGTLAPGAQTTLEVSVDQAVAGGLAAGMHWGAVWIADLTHAVTATRSFGLDVQSSSGTQLASSLSQFGITWSFDHAYPVGTFANGDWWVEGPVTITGIDPPSRDVGGRVTNGSMVNPTPSARGQGYDSAMFGAYARPGSYDDALNVALDVSGSQPLVVPPASSLVSAISLPAAGVRPQLRTAAVLTVLAAPAPPGSFRPPFCGDDKTLRFNQSQLDRSQLANLAPVVSTPEMRQVEAGFERPWIDHGSDWTTRYLHPQDNMPDYGREMADEVGTAALMLHLDLPASEKETLLVRFVQLGIDDFGTLASTSHAIWQPNGGHHSGRKWPILFAGLMLGDARMSSIGLDGTFAPFGEDAQTFFVEETSPGVYNRGFGGYGPQQVGLAEWGNQHSIDPSLDDSDWFGDPYRVCCTSNAWWGSVLAAHIMGARSLWNWEPLFEYQDRYRSEARMRGQVPWTVSWTAFPINMWDAYRARY